MYIKLFQILFTRETATLADRKTALSKEIMSNGMNEIKKYLGISAYSDILKTVSSKKLLNALDTADTYEKIVTVRLLFERYEGLLSKLKKKYPAACKFVNETNHVENDYIFQLDPFKFFQIPQYYLNEIELFLAEEKETILKRID